MKTKFILFMAVLSAALVFVAAGCATSKETQTTALLTQAGFKVLPASTFEKQQKLKSVKPGQVSGVKGADGQPYYVYPVHAQDVLYVGRSAEYPTYRNLLLNQQMREKDLKGERAARWERQAEAASGYQSSWEEVWSAPHQ